MDPGKQIILAQKERRSKPPQEGAIYGKAMEILGRLPVGPWGIYIIVVPKYRRKSVIRLTKKSRLQYDSLAFRSRRIVLTRLRVTRRA